jgi:hypothetical protein
MQQHFKLGNEGARRQIFQAAVLLRDGIKVFTSGHAGTKELGIRKAVPPTLTHFWATRWMRQRFALVDQARRAVESPLEGGAAPRKSFKE